jgi:predicted N-acyltransferase
MQQSTGLSVKIVRKIADIPRKEWDAIFPDVLEGYRFFKSIDESDFDGISFYYIVAYKKDALVGAAPCLLMDYPFDTTVDGLLKNVSSKIREFFPAILNSKMLLCGSIASEGRFGITDTHRGQVMKEIVRGMERIAKNEKAAILTFKDYPLEYVPSLDLLLKEDFYKMRGYPSVKIDIDFDSFDDYIKTLSYSTRKDLKRKFKKIDALEKIDFEVTDNVDDFLDEAYFLYLQTFYRSGVIFEKIPKNFFKSISRNMKDNAKYFLWRIKGRLVAFDLCLADENTLVDEYLGIDYLMTHKYSLYFITFRDIINWCIKNNIKKYESGALTYEPKKRLGCTFIPHYIYVKHMNKFINPFFKILCFLLRPENFDATVRQMKRQGLI